MKLIKKPALACIILLSQILGFSPLAQAALVELGDGGIWDTDRGIDWFKLVSPVPGGLTLAEARIAKNGINTLLGTTTWRLPSAFNSDGTTVCTGLTGCNDSELGHLYYKELINQVKDTNGNVLSQTFKKDSNGKDIFPFLAGGDVFWSDTGTGTDFIAFNFSINLGGGSQLDKGPSDHAQLWLVRDHVSPVPLPAAV